MVESDILHEQGPFWISTAKAAGLKWNGFAVWETGATCSRLCASIGYTGDKGLAMAKSEIERRLKTCGKGATQ